MVTTQMVPTDQPVQQKLGTVEIKGLPSNTSEDHTTLYFENSKHGGGPIKHIQMTEGRAIITFEQPKGMSLVSVIIMHKPYNINTLNSYICALKILPINMLAIISAYSGIFLSTRCSERCGPKPNNRRQTPDGQPIGHIFRHNCHNVCN